MGELDPGKDARKLFEGKNAVNGTFGNYPFKGHWYR